MRQDDDTINLEEVTTRLEEIANQQSSASDAQGEMPRSGSDAQGERRSWHNNASSSGTHSDSGVSAPQRDEQNGTCSFGTDPIIWPGEDMRSYNSLPLTDEDGNILTYSHFSGYPTFEHNDAATQTDDIAVPACAEMACQTMATGARPPTAPGQPRVTKQSHSEPPRLGSRCRKPLISIPQEPRGYSDPLPKTAQKVAEAQSSQTQTQNQVAASYVHADDRSRNSQPRRRRHRGQQIADEEPAQVKSWPAFKKESLKNLITLARNQSLRLVAAHQDLQAFIRKDQGRDLNDIVFYDESNELECKQRILDKVSTVRAMVLLTDLMDADDMRTAQEAVRALIDDKECPEILVVWVRISGCMASTTLIQDRVRKLLEAGADGVLLHCEEDMSFPINSALDSYQVVMERITVDQNNAMKRCRELQDHNLELLWEHVLPRSMPSEMRILPSQSTSEPAIHYENRLGSGKFSKVYRCRPGRSQHLEAVKVFEKIKAVTFEEAHDLATLALREIRILSMGQLVHPFIIQFIDVVHTQRYVYIFLDFGGNENLHQFQKSQHNGRLPLSLLQVFFRHITEAVAHIHSHDICHRDVKPDNVTISQTETQAKLCDFGLATMIRSYQYAPGAFSTGTRRCGTLPFMAPEVLDSTVEGYQGNEIDCFALGVSMFEAYHGSGTFANLFISETPLPKPTRRHGLE